MNRYTVFSLLVIIAGNTVTMAVSEYSTMGAEGGKHGATATTLSQADATTISSGLKIVNANAAKYTGNKSNLKAALVQINAIKGISVININNSFQTIAAQIQNDQYVLAKGSSSALLSAINNNINQATNATLKSTLTDAKNQLTTFNATLDALSKL